MTIRNRRARAERDALCRLILDLRKRRPWYYPPLTVKEIQQRIHEAIGWQISEKTIDRGLKALREGKHLDTFEPPRPL